MLEFRGPEVQVGGTRLETYPKAADSRTRGRGAAKESRIPPRLVRGEWLKPFLHLSVLKDQLGLVSDSSTISHTHARTHTRARARSWRAGVCRARGIVGSRQSGAGAGRHGEHPRQSGLEKAPSACLGQPGYPSSSPTPAPARPTSAVAASFYSQQGLPFLGCLA